MSYILGPMNVSDQSSLSVGAHHLRDSIKPLHLLTLLPHEGQGPGEDVHEVGQPVGVGGAVELADVHHVVLVLQHGRWEGHNKPTPQPSSAQFSPVQPSSTQFSPVQPSTTQTTSPTQTRPSLT